MSEDRWWVQEDPPGTDQGTLLKGIGITCLITFGLFVLAFQFWPAFLAPPVVLTIVASRFQDRGETRTAKGVFVSMVASFGIAILLLATLAVWAANLDI